MSRQACWFLLLNFSCLRGCLRPLHGDDYEPPRLQGSGLRTWRQWRERQGCQLTPTATRVRADLHANHGRSWSHGGRRSRSYVPRSSCWAACSFKFGGVGRCGLGVDPSIGREGVGWYWRGASVGWWVMFVGDHVGSYGSVVVSSWQ